ncbi:hypothetical protein [Halorarius litoreus]|uniref:hypothetical protein n=1 Tax=Halorarius litoreus TaxID=2962676 RepID=UPI0020CFB019|nr:hypothetical protein [Halorarius litoreus]
MRRIVLDAIVINAVLWLLAAFALLTAVIFYAAGTGGVIVLDFTLFGELWVEVLLVYAMTPIISVGVAHLLSSYFFSNRPSEGQPNPDESAGIGQDG